MSNIKHQCGADANTKIGPGFHGSLKICNNALIRETAGESGNARCGFCYENPPGMDAKGEIDGIRARATFFVPNVLKQFGPSWFRPSDYEVYAVVKTS